jgi:ABC-type branched-subunit amino acid transport system ATPase component
MKPLLEVRDIETLYGASQVLFGVSFDVHEGELVTLIGRNGMGKSTTIKTLMGLLAPAKAACRSAASNCKAVQAIASLAPASDWCRKGARFFRI